MGWGRPGSRSPKDAQSGESAEPAPAPPAHPAVTGLGWPPAPSTPPNTQPYRCSAPAPALPHTASDNSDGLMGNVPRLLTGAAECHPWVGSPRRARRLMALVQACVSAGESKQYFSSAAVLQQPRKVPASTFALAQTRAPQNPTRCPWAPCCLHRELLTSRSPRRHPAGTAPRVVGANRGAGGAAGPPAGPRPQNPPPAAMACAGHPGAAAETPPPELS